MRRESENKKEVCELGCGIGWKAFGEGYSVVEAGRSRHRGTERVAGLQPGEGQVIREDRISV